MTKQQLIEKWRNKEIAIENDDRNALIKCITLLGAKAIPEGARAFYIFCYDECGWDGLDETDLPTIKATEALQILTETQPINELEPQPNRTPEHYRVHLMQPWDMLVKIYGAKAVALHLRMSAFEYRMRAGYKDESASDLAKAMHCEAKAKELEGGEE